MLGYRFMWIVTLLSGLLWLSACDDSTVQPDDDDDDGGSITCTKDSECPDGQHCDAISGLCQYYADGDDDNGFVMPTSDGDYEEIEVVEDYGCEFGNLKFDKTLLDFQAVQIGQSAVMTFTVENDSRDFPVTIYAVDYNSILYTPEFEILTDPNDPDVDNDYVYPFEDGNSLTLEPGDRFTFYVRYSPADANVVDLDAGFMDQGFILLTSDDCDSAFTQVELLSRMKGNKYACLCVVDPTSNECIDEETPLIDFGNVDVGAPPAMRIIRVRHCGDEDGNALLGIRQVAMGSGVSANFWFESGQVGSLDNVLLSPNRSHEIVVKFQPTAIIWPDQHMEKVIIETTSDNPSERLLEVELRGTTMEALIQIVPNPVDFGLVRHTTTEACDDGTGGKDELVTVYNFTGSDMKLREYKIRSLSGSTEENTQCQEVYRVSFPEITEINDPDFPGSSYDPADYYEPGTNWGVPFLSATGVVPLYVNIQYCPLGPDIRNDSNCLLTFTTVPDPNVEDIDPTRWQYPLIGEQRPPNQAPIARISVSSHGPEVTVPIEGIQQNSWFNFYGDTSSDEDSRHQIQDIEWFWEELPEGVTEAMMGQNMREISSMPASCGGSMLPTGISVKWPKHGTYILGLKVQDCEGAWSDPTFAEIYVQGNQGLDIILNFTAGDNMFLTKNIVDMDLSLTDPRGGLCVDNNTDTYGTCSRILPQFGSMTMPITSQGAGCCGTTEEIVYYQPVDGTGFRLAVTLIEDCEDWSTNILQWNFCADRHDPDWTIEIYDPRSGDMAPLKTYSGRMTEVGQRWEKRLSRENGIWIFPE